MMKKLHPTQKKLLKLLSKHIEDPLTIRELQVLVEASSTSVVHHHLKQLEKKGFLKRNANYPRDYVILDKNPDKPVAYLNLYGLANCGPSGSILDGSPIEKIPIPTRLIDFPSPQAFMVKARGDSMTPRINDGDLLVVKRSRTAQNGDTIVCVNNGEAIVKKIKNGKKPILISLNPKYEPFVANDDFQIEGIVRSVYSHNI